VQSIAHILPSPRDSGGLAAVVKGLDEAGRRRGLDSHVIGVVPDGHAPSKWPGGEPADANRLLATLRAMDAVVVHGVFQADVARASRLIARRLPGLPVVRMPHDPYDEGLFATRRMLKRVWFLLIERPALNNSVAVFTTAPTHERWLRARGVRARVLTHPLGLTPEEGGDGREVLRRRAVRTPRIPSVLLQVGRWDVDEKGIDLAVAAAAELGSGTAVLRLVGPPGESHRPIQRLVEAAQAPVELVGFVRSVWTELAEADLVLMPSRKEGFGLASLQALSAGVPIVLSARAGLAEFVTRADGCVLTAPEPTALVAALRDALGDLPALTAGARSFANERAAAFSYDALLDALLGAFGETS